MIKNCQHCDSEFETKFRTRCCSIRCEQLFKQAYNKVWCRENPEKTRAINKKVQLKRRISGKEGEYREHRRKTKGGYIDRFMERIRSRNPDTDITRAYLLSIYNDSCAVSKIPFEYTKNYIAYHNALAPSIDRIDSQKGYYIGNVQIILSCINRMKNDMPNEEFLKLWSALVD